MSNESVGCSLGGNYRLGMICEKDKDRAMNLTAGFMASVISLAIMVANYEEKHMAEELSLVIQNPTEGEFLKHIEWNKKQFEELIARTMKQYEGITYTDEQIKDAKNDRSTLNAMKKAISDRRIQVKKAVMEPYTQFETEVNEVVALIDKPIKMIDGQIKEYEERVKNEKKQALKAYFEEIALDLEGVLTFDRVFDQRYLNATVSLNKAKTDIREKVERVNTDLNTLNSLDAEYRMFARDVYMKTFDMSKAMAEISRLQELKKREEERICKEEEAKAAREAEIKAAESVSESDEIVQKTEESVQNPVKNVTKTDEIVHKPFENVTEPEGTVNTAASIDVPDTSVAVPEEDTKQYKASFTVYGTKAEIMGLKQYMIEHKIKFGKVEK